MRHVRICLPLNSAPAFQAGYDTKQETVALQGLPAIQIRSLLGKQQFHNPLEAAYQGRMSTYART